MRLRDYQFLLEKCEESLLKYTSETKYVGNQQQKGVKQFKIPITMVNELSINNLFEKKTKIILNNYDYMLTTVNDEILMEINAFKDFDNKMKDLNYLVTEFKQTLDKIVTPEKENVINFKLPNDIKNIEQFNKFVKDLNDALMFCQRIKVQPKFAGLDTGSSWIQFVIDSYPLILFIFTLLVGFLKTAKLYLETEKLWNERIEREKSKKVSQEKIQYLENLKKEELEEHRTEEDKIIRETIEKVGISNFFANASKDVQSDIGELNEFVNAVDISMRKMVELLGRGMEIHPAIKATEETKAIAQDIQKQVSAYQQFAIGITDIKSIPTEESKEKNNSVQNEE